MAPIVHRLRGLSPFGPIFAKELIATARRKRSYLLRVAYLGLLLLVLLWGWAMTGTGGGGVAARAQAQAELGAMFFFTFALFSVGAMSAVGPVLTCTAIGSERLAKTLPVLLMTPISAWQITAGKLSSRLLVALTLLGLSLPVLALVRLLGGVELWQMAAVLCLAASAVIFSASLGLLLSTLMTRAFAVILLSYGFLLLAYLFVPILIGINDQTNGRTFFTWVPRFNPFVATFLVSAPSGMLIGLGAGLNAWPWCAGVHLALAALNVVASALLLRRASRQIGEGAAAVNPAEYVPLASAAAAPADDPAQAGVQVAPPAPPHAGSPEALPYAAPAIKARPAAPTREVSDRPVLWRELRRPLFVRRWQGLVGAAFTVGLLALTYWSLSHDGDLAHQDTQIGYALIFTGLTWLLVSVLSATVIAQEKESDTWTLLLATPLSGADVVRGKVWGVLRRAVWPAALMALHFAIFTVAGIISWVTLSLVLWVILTFNSVWLATGVYLSLRLRKVTAAVIVNLLLAVGAYAVVPMVLAILGAWLVLDVDAAEHVLWYMPYWYLGEWISRADSLNLYDGARRFWLPGDMNASSGEFLLTAFIAGSLHLVAAGLILLWTARRFDRIVGRAEQISPSVAPRTPALHAQPA